MPIDEYVSSPLVSRANSFIAERYLAIRSGNTPPDVQQIPNGLEEVPLPQLIQEEGPIPRYQNHVDDVPYDALNGVLIMDHDQLLNLEPQPPYPPHPLAFHPPAPHPPAPRPENYGFAIVQTPVPSYDGANMNMCYSVDRLDLN